MNSQDFVLGEFEKRGINCAAYFDTRIAEEEFDLAWMESENHQSSDVEKRAQVKAAEDAEKLSVSFRLWKWPKDREEIERRFSRKYETYMSSEVRPASLSAEERLGELLDLLGQLTTYVIYQRISYQQVYRIGDEETITQEGHHDALIALRTDKESGIPRNEALCYYLQIYKNKTMDYLAFYGLLKKKGDDQKNDKGRRGHKGAINAASSIEALTMHLDHETAADRMPEFSENPFEEDSGYLAESARNILNIYLEELLHNSNIPPAPLAVVYARVLYQMERLLDPDTVDILVARYMKKRGWEDNPGAEGHQVQRIAKATEEVQKYTTSTATDWAMGRMGAMTISELGADSEAVLHRLFDDTLAWGESFVNHLDMVAERFQPQTWGKLVYTACYQKGQIENWAADIHNSTVIKAARRICADSALLAYVLDELSDRGRLKREVRKRQEKIGKRGAVRK